MNALDVDNNVSTYAIIGDDDRVVDFTKSGVVKILTNSAMGTGFVVDSHTIATGAHCVYNQTINNILLFDVNGNVSLSATPLEYHVPTKYIIERSKGRETNEYDYALITVEEDLSNYACFDLGVMLPNFVGSQNAISVTGFPGVVNNQLVNNSTIHNMYTGNGVTLDSAGHDIKPDLQFIYNNDITGGNSGGPVYVSKNYYGKVYYTVIGINVGSSDDYGIATSINTDLLHFYLHNSNI